MKLITSLVTLGFADFAFGQVAEELTMTLAFDFSSLVKSGHDCDLRVNALVSLITCGGIITSFDTILAFKKKELLNVLTHEGKATFINR